MHPVLLKMFFLTTKLVGEFISQFSMAWGQTRHRRRNNIFINNLCTYLYWKFQTTWFCAASGVTFRVHESHKRARQKVSSSASQCCATPQCQNSGVKCDLAMAENLLQHHFGKYLIFRINLIFLNTGRSFCLQLLQCTMRTNIFGRSVCVIFVSADRDRLPQKHAAAFPSHSHLKAVLVFLTEVWSWAN